MNEMLPNSIAIALLIESALVGMTTLLLWQPSRRLRGAAKAFGLALLCATFCWSFFFGSILAMHHYALGLTR